MQKISLLLLEDNAEDAYLTIKVLENSGMNFNITTVSNKAGYVKAIQAQEFDIILSDNELPQFSASEALKITKENNCHVPFILVTGTISEEYAVNIMKEGAWDYLLKDRLQRLPNAIQGAIDKYQLEVEKQKNIDALIENEKKYRHLFENSPFPQWIIDSKTFQFLDVNNAAILHYGYSRDEFLSMTAVDIRPEDEKKRFLNRESIPANSFVNRGLWKHLKKDGTVIEAEINVNEMTFEGKISHLVVINDVSAIKEAERKLINVNRMYAFTSQINQAIVHINDEQQLFDEACRIAVEVGKFELACIDRFDESNYNLELVAQNNANPMDVELFKTLKYTETGAIAKMLHNDKYYVINDYSKETEQGFWSQYAFQHEFRSAILLPLKKMGKTEYVFSIFSKNVNTFTEDEIALLDEAAGDISFVLDVWENDRQKALAENKLKHNELRLRQAQEIAHFGNWELSFANGVAVWSEEACRIYGLPPDQNEYNYETWLSFIHPDDVAYVVAESNKAQATLSRSGFFHRIIRRDGTIRHIYSQSQFEFDSEGKPIGLYGVAHDVTEMKEAEEALKQSQSNLRLIVDLIPQAIFAMDANGKFVFANKAFAELYGLKPKQIVYKMLEDILKNKEMTEAFLSQAKQVISFNKSITIDEMPFTDHLGNKRIFYSVKVPYTLVNGEKVMLGISLDITSQKKTESERAKIIADIVQRNKDLEQFSYIVSHNLRAPVANIIGLSDLMMMMEHNKDEQKMMMNELSTTVMKLDNVIKDLNYILQVKHQVNESKELIKFSDLLSDIKQSIDILLLNEDVKIVADFSVINEMHTIKSYLYSIFFNLISNSIKYRQHGIRPVIEISSNKENGNTVLKFKDNGMGIDLEQKGKYVFGLYKRFHLHTEGKGMGLYMVKTQVEALGGRISVDSQVDKGTTFNIVFENK